MSFSATLHQPLPLQQCKYKHNIQTQTADGKSTALSTKHYVVFTCWKNEHS